MVYAQRRKRGPRKARNLLVTREYLAERRRACKHEPKWIYFCEFMLAKGLTVSLYEAKETVSKYVTVSLPERGEFKVRFSNHKPNKYKEVNRYCDFFVGYNNFGNTTTQQAIFATLNKFGMQYNEPKESELHDFLYS